jgi:superfamily II DNA or RNA helicase
MNITIGNRSIITEAGPATVRAIQDHLTFRNPEYTEARRRGFSVRNIEPEIQCYQETELGLIIPRGASGQIIRIGRHFNESIQIIDNRRALPDVDFQFQGKLRPYQDDAVQAVMKKDFGVLQAPTGSGKTTMAEALIALRRQPALVVCHNKELLNQWVDRTETFLGIPKSEIGIIGDGKKRIGDRVTIGLVQSVYQCAADIAPFVGFLIIDECHRAPSRTFSEAVTAFDCKFMLGLSATPFRKDGLTRLINFHLGDTLFQVDAEALLEGGSLCQAVVSQVQTEFRTRFDPSTQYSKVLSALTQNDARNALVAGMAAAESSRVAGIVLCLSDRKAHCETLQEILTREHGLSSDVLTGDLSNGKRAALVDRLRAGDVKILIATGQLVGEGFDLPGIESLLLATPLKFDGRLLQYVGRALRPAPGKDFASIIDFVDHRVGVLANAARSRARLYMRSPGIKILN